MANVRALEAHVASYTCVAYPSMYMYVPYVCMYESASCPRLQLSLANDHEAGCDHTQL
jgi:hypothetical protein